MKFARLFPLLAPALLAGGSVLRAEENAWDALVRNSPFGAPATRTEATTSAAAGPEFRGYYAEGREQFFSIYDPASRRSYWLRRGEAAGALAVTAFAADQQILHVELAGRALTLPLARAKLLTMPATAGGANRPPQLSTPPAEEASVGTPGASEEVRQSEQDLALARQRQAYEARRKTAQEKLRLARVTRAGTAGP